MTINSDWSEPPRSWKQSIEYEAAVDDLRSAVAGVIAGLEPGPGESGSSYITKIEIACAQLKILKVEASLNKAAHAILANRNNNGNN